MTDREVMQQALEAMEQSTPKPRVGEDEYCEQGFAEHFSAIAALRDRLAQPEQEDLNLACKSVQARLASLWGYVKAQPEQEPVAWMESPHGAIRANPAYKLNFPSQLLHWQIPLYTTPPQRNKLAAWMMQRGYATGHGDTIEDLLKELEWQVIEREREACAKVCEELVAHTEKDKERDGYFAAVACTLAIRARGKT